jgi:hypothetical protein
MQKHCLTNNLLNFRRNQKFIGYGDMEVTIGDVADSFEDGAPIKTSIMTILVDVARDIFLSPETKRLIVPFMAVVRNIIIIINIFLHARLYAEI